MSGFSRTFFSNRRLVSGDAGRRPLAVAATNATGASVCRQPEPSLRARFHQPPPPRASRQMHTVVVASIASVVSPPLLALRSTTAAQDTAALQTDPPAASRGGPPQSVNVVSGLSRRPPGPVEVCREEVVKPLLNSDLLEFKAREGYWSVPRRPARAIAAFTSPLDTAAATKLRA